MKNTKRISVRNKYLLAGFAIVLVLGMLFIFNLPRKSEVEVKSFQDCVDQGYVVMKSYPMQCRTPRGELFIEEITPEESCSTLYSGNWLSKHNECENIQEEQCTLLGGEFNECASACRHDPDAEFCIMVCVPVCKL